MREPLADAGPAERLPGFRFGVRFRVEVADTDLGGHVYYGHYPVYVDRAVIAYRRHLGVAPLGPPGHLFVVRALELEYTASARFDEEIEAFVRAVRLGGSSHTLEVRFERLDGDGRGEPAAAARVTVVGLEAYGGRPSRMPESMREAMTAFEGAALERP